MIHVKTTIAHLQKMNFKVVLKVVIFQFFDLISITYPMIKHLSQNSLNNLLHLYNRIFIEHVFPAAWHDAVVIPFQKPGKDSTDQRITAPSPSLAAFAKSWKKWSTVGLFIS